MGRAVLSALRRVKEWWLLPCKLIRETEREAGLDVSLLSPNIVNHGEKEVDAAAVLLLLLLHWALVADRYSMVPQF